MVKVTRYILEDLFDKYNKMYFEGKLVKPQLATYWGESTMGIFNVSERHGKVRRKILIARNVRYTQENLRDVLIHEMIHLYVYQEIGPGYGPDRMAPPNQGILALSPIKPKERK